MIDRATTIPQTYQIQFNFHFDLTQRLLTLARALPDELYHAQVGYSHGSIHDTFVHLLGADQLWRKVIAHLPNPEHLPACADIAAIDAWLAVERQGWDELLAPFDGATLFETFARETPWGSHVFTLWTTLQHVILHGMQHHSELARMLTAVGHSPGDTDFLTYVDFPTAGDLPV